MPDLDDLGDLLDRLAPDIDDAASRALFDRRRAGRRRRRPAHVAGVAAVVLLVAALGAIALGVANRDTTLQVGGDLVPTDPDAGDGAPQAELEVLDMRPASEPMGTLRAAVDDAGFAELWRAIGFDVPRRISMPAGGSTVPDPVRPVVDFDRWVVVSITIPDDACPPTLIAFTRVGSVLTPVFVEPEGGCNQPLDPKTYVVAIDRSTVEPAFTLRLPSELTYRSGEQRLDVDVPAADPSVAASAGLDELVDGQLVAAVDLPAPGDARSALLADGTPIWVVHHEDGSASAVPGLVADPPDDPNDDTGTVPDGFWSLVLWNPSGGFTGHGNWDSWGRAIDDGSSDVGSRDLTGYTAEIAGNMVLVRHSSADGIAGLPVVPPDPYTAPTGPELPPLATDDERPIGWSQVDADVVGVGGAFAVCPGPPLQDAGQLLPCPQGSPTVAGLTGPPGLDSWSSGPLLVRTDATGQIDTVVRLGTESATFTRP